MHKRDAKEILHKYRAGTCTETEKVLVERWYYQLQKEGLELNEERIDEIGQDIWLSLPIHEYSTNPVQAKSSVSVRELPSSLKTPSRFRTIRRTIAAAAAILIVISVGIFFYTTIPTNTLQSSQIDVVPGGNNAVLTLADGSTINLSDDHNGIIIESDNIKYSDGSSLQGMSTSPFVIQSDSEEPLSTKEAYLLALSTPKGGQYQIILPDGTKVWLNSASTLKYPSRFNSTERNVELVGEAYFEVAENRKKPFIVKSLNQSVEVLGTHFNINAYNDEGEVRTTLLEGSVRVSITNKEEQVQSSKLLQPNQQSTISSISDNIKINTINPSSAIAWKDGLFRFDNASIYTLMMQLSRWYDIDVQFSQGVKYEPFFGEIERSYNLSEVLKVLELGGVHFRMEKTDGRTKITVMP